MSVTSCPALVSMPPTTLPMAPAPMIPIRIAMDPLLAGHDNLNRHDVRLRSSRRPAAHRQLQVAEVPSGRPATLGGGHGFPVARAGDPSAARTRRARRVRLPGLRAARVPRAVRRPAPEALRLARLPGRGG